MTDYTPDSLNRLWTITRKINYRADGSWKSTKITWSDSLSTFASSFGMLKFDWGRMVIAGVNGSTQIGSTL
jgi:hypothetical protein